MWLCEAKLIITKKTGKIQPVLSQILYHLQVPFEGLKVISLYQIIVFYANLFLAEHIFVLGYFIVGTRNICFRSEIFSD